MKKTFLAKMPFRMQNPCTMRPFRLNDASVDRNPLLGSHDPSMMWDPVTKMYYSYSTDVYRPDWGLKDGIGIPVRCSSDLVSFRYLGTVLSDKSVKEGSDNGIYPPTRNFWAPYTEYTGGEYRMYYSATRAFGSSESRIWLAVSQRPEGPFENRGVAVDTWGTDDTYPNAIDPHIVRDSHGTWLVYGSFFGGIYIKELDEKTGLSKDGNSKSLGICISRKSSLPRIDGPEGASVIYHPENGCFYLFQSYGWLGDNYDIRVGRSRNVCGPYVDPKGKCLVEESMGLKLAGSYCFTAENFSAGSDVNFTGAALASAETNEWNWAGLRGPGHGVPFYDPVRQQYFFVHHVRDGAEIYRHYDRKERRNSYELHLMMIRRMFFVNDWPVFSPEPFAGIEEEMLSPQMAEGCWELIFLSDENNDIKYSKQRDLNRNSALLQKGIIHTGWDFENGKRNVLLSGITEDGVAYWGKMV